MQKDINSLDLELIVGGVSALTLQPTIYESIQGAQELDPELYRIREEVQKGSNSKFSLTSDGVLNLRGRLCVPNDDDLRT